MSARDAMPALTPLPIDALIPEIVATLRKGPNLVLEAPPGAGKTTRVPAALLDAGLLGDGEVIVLQPRRLAARLAARRVAEERGERLGETVGYQVRFEESASARTRIRFVTEGILTRRLLGDPTLRGVTAVVLDEFHERHLHGDMALALLRRLQSNARPDLRVVVMSATLETAPVAAFLGAPTLRSEGRRFDVTTEYIARPDERPLAQQVASALARLVSDGLDGHVLVFLPGAAEIRRARESCAPIAERQGLLVLPLHGDLPPAEQDRAVRPSEQRKVILSTNVAETSVTIDGVVAVIDSGLARIASHAPWSGLPVLKLGRISRASAAQREGRAGRTRPGRCVRLYTRHDHDTRPAHDEPEIRRLDLAESVLELRASGVTDPRAFAWFEAPADASLAAADGLLARLGAVAATGAVTESGRRMLRFPLHPRLSRVVLEGEARGVADDACTIAAILGEGDLRATGGFGDARAAHRAERARSDVLELLDLFDAAAQDRLRAETVRALGLDLGAVHAVDRVRTQITRLANRDGARPPSPAAYENALLACVLAGYPDRVGRRRAAPQGATRAGTEILFATGGTAVLAETSVVRDAAYVVAIDAEQRVDARGARVLVRLASEIDPDWLLEMFTDAVRDVTEARWIAAGERVEVVRALRYEGLVLEESPATVVDEAVVARVLADAALAKGIRHFVDAEAFDRFVTRVTFLRNHRPNLGLPTVDDALLRATIEAAAHGARTFRDLRNADLLESLRAQLTPAQRNALDELAPEWVKLPSGRRARIEYAPDAPPSVASRLQDFFGMTEGPRVLGGAVPLVLHLLAPNQRAVQVTTDLAGFWSRHYPTIARELRRKYPKHAWPDDPLRATR